MKKFSVADILDIIFTAFISFIIFFVILNYFIPRPYSFIVAGALTVIVLLPVYRLIVKNSAGRKLKKAEKAVMDETLTHLSVSDKKRQTEVFTTALSNLDLSFEKKRGYISVPDKNIDVFIYTEVDGLKKADVVKAFNTAGDRTAVIFSCYVDSGVKSFSERFGEKIRIIYGKSLYLFLKNSDALPKNFITLKKEKPTTGFLDRILDGKKAVKYVLFGLAFFGLSFLVRYKVYYLTMGCLFSALSLIAVLFRRQREKDSEIPTL